MSPGTAPLMAACRFPPAGTTSVAAKAAEAEIVKIEIRKKVLISRGETQRIAAHVWEIYILLRSMNAGIVELIVQANWARRSDQRDFRFDREHTTGTRPHKSCDTITKFLRSTVNDVRFVLTTRTAYAVAQFVSVVLIIRASEVTTKNSKRLIELCASCG